MKTIKIAVVGYGGMGSYHVRELIAKNPNVEVGAIYDIDPDKREKAKANNYKTYDTFTEVLDDPTIEAILIATPNDTHKVLAIDSLHAGKHVICEKPAMMSTEELDEVLGVAKDMNRIFMVHQNRRWDEDFLTIRNLYQNHQIGELFQIESRVHGANGIPGDWRHLKAHGGGMLLDWGVHLLDQILFMVDSPIKSVAADLSYVLGDEVDDGFICYLTFENDVKAIVEVGTSNFIKLPRWYVKGFEGTGTIEDWDLSGCLVKPTNVVVEHHDLKPIQAGQGLTKTMAPPSEERTEIVSLPEGKAEFPSFYTNFYEVVRCGKEPVVKNSEVRKIMRLMETIFEAAQKQQILPFVD